MLKRVSGRGKEWKIVSVRVFERGRVSEWVCERNRERKKKSEMRGKGSRVKFDFQNSNYKVFLFVLLYLEILLNTLLDWCLPNFTNLIFFLYFSTYLNNNALDNKLLNLPEIEIARLNLTFKNIYVWSNVLKFDF